MKSIREVVFQCKKYNAKESLGLNLIDHVIERERSFQFCVEMGKKICGKDRSTYKGIKLQLYINEIRELNDSNAEKRLFDANSKL